MAVSRESTFLYLTTFTILILSCILRSSGDVISSYSVDPYDSYQTYELQEVPHQPIQRPRQYARPRSFWSTASDVTARAFKGAESLVGYMWLPIALIFAYDMFVPQVKYFRVKRDADSESVTTERTWEDVLQLYLAVSKSEECLERMVCELGNSTTKPIPKSFRSIFLTMFDEVTPTKYQKLLQKFRVGAERNEACQKIHCKALEGKKI